MKPTVQVRGIDEEDEPYVRWLRHKNVRLYEGGGVLWRLYQDHCLLSVSFKPTPLQLESRTAQDLLRQSGAALLRYFTTTFEQPTAFWYVECAEYSLEKLSKDTRRQIKQGHERCEVRQIDPEWLAANGYPCYLSAFARYQHAKPQPISGFRQLCLDALGGPFEYWGVFAGGKLVGYMKCILGTGYVACVVLKLDPAFLRLHPTYALKDDVLTRYVKEQGRTAYDGFRAVSHQTNVHEFFLRFGYRRVYCDLQVHYRPAIAALVKLLYPLRRATRYAPSSALVHKIQVLLGQEEIRRSFAILAAGLRHVRAKS